MNGAFRDVSRGELLCRTTNACGSARGAKLEDESAEVDVKSKARTGRLTRRKQALDDVKGDWFGQREGSRGEDCGGGGVRRESIVTKCQGAARWSTGKCWSMR